MSVEDKFDGLMGIRTGLYTILGRVGGVCISKRLKIVQMILTNPLRRSNLLCKSKMMVKINW